jgi:hypothetical protein
VAGRTIAEAEDHGAGGTRIRRGAFAAADQLLESSPDITLRSGDIVAISARRDVLVKMVGNTEPDEVEDRELLDMPRQRMTSSSRATR